MHVSSPNLLQVRIGDLAPIQIAASVGNDAAFRKGREFAAWMGLVPKQFSTGGKARLYEISKRGDRFLRKIQIHGATQWCCIDRLRPPDFQGTLWGAGADQSTQARFRLLK
jgi:transposase